jgi:hypothetical protein
MRFVSVIVLAGCTGSTTKPTGETGDDTGDTGPGAATFSRVRDEVLVPTCAISACHAVGTQGSGFVLPEGEEHAAIVGVESQFAPGEVLVVPGDPDASYLVLKLEDAVGIAGSPMPPPFGNLDPDQIALVRAWIDAGALEN